MNITKNIGVLIMTRTILVTGSSRGLGAAIVKKLVQQDFQVVINYFRNKKVAEKLVAQIGQKKGIAIQADVTNRRDVESLVNQATAHFGQIDVVVNNALIDFKFDPAEQKPFTELTWDDYQTQLNGTLKAAFNVSQSVMSQFIEREDGHIISIGTNLYQNPVVPYHEYTTAKAGLIGDRKSVV